MFVIYALYYTYSMYEFAFDKILHKTDHMFLILNVSISL